jgi:hypothetical protein
MNRRQFLGRVVLGSAALSPLASSAHAAAQTGGVHVKFIGMMGYITRTDQSVLVAMPGPDPMNHFPHVPFLMAASGSRIAKALGMTSMPGVVAGAFDDRLAGTADGAFQFRCLDGCDVEIDAGGAPVDHRATFLAQMNKIAPGARLRTDLRRWSTAAVTLRGGQLNNDAAHPDAGKVWSFGAYRQPLTDATLYQAAAATIRLIAGATVSTYIAAATERSELWIVSASGPRTDTPDPKRLEHGAILFEYFEDAQPVPATCEEAEGRITLATELPCALTSYASRDARTAATIPPHVDLCYGGGWCEPCL